MNLKFVVNDYILIWNLLFQASISENIHKVKQKIWLNYKKEYNETYKDKLLILKDPKNFIPNDDTIYNIILEIKEYEKIKKNTERFRMHLLKIWDDNKKQVIKEIKDILRFDIKIYTVFVIPDTLNIIDVNEPKDKRVNTIIWGRAIDSENYFNTIIKLIFEIVKNEMKNYKTEYSDIVKAIIEIAVLNEFATRLTGISYYLAGDSTLKFLKRQIYPYWLMYLGVEENELRKYMERDKICYDLDKYPYERQLRKLDLYEFIDFCIRNQKYIVKIDELEII